MKNVLLTGNNKVFPGICLNVLSILKYTKEPVHIHIMTIQVSWDNQEKISLESVNLLRTVVKNKSPESEVSYYDVSKDLEDDFKDSPNKNPAYTPASLTRLFFTRYINCDKLIYLDADTMCNKSLAEFDKIDISKAEMGVCLDYLGKFWLKKDYFNSGVLYINVKRVKETNLFENAIKLLKEKKLFFSDQTALYKLSKERVYMPMCYNEQRDVKDDTVIKHFCKGIRYLPFFKIYNVKQWQVSQVHSFLKLYAFDDIYEEYHKLFPTLPKLN